MDSENGVDAGMIDSDEEEVEEGSELYDSGKRKRKRNRPRSRTIAMKRLSKEEMAEGASLIPFMNYERPKCRYDCTQGARMRPCAFVSCKYHLYLDVNPDTGSIKLNFPHLEVWELQETCALDVAERGGITLEEVGEIMNLTRERIRQVEVRGLMKLKMSASDVGITPND